MRSRPMVWLALFVALFVLPLVWSCRRGVRQLVRHWNDAWDSAELAVRHHAGAGDPGLRRPRLGLGVFAVHSWIVFKPEGAPGLRALRGDRLGGGRGAPGGAQGLRRDRRLLVRQSPKLLADRRGPGVGADRQSPRTRSPATPT